MSSTTKATEYISKTKFVVLATTGVEGIPFIRTLASFANEDLTIFFSTGKKTAKVEQIKSNNQVALLFQHEGQELSGFQNVTIAGEAKAVTNDSELAKAIQLLSDRSPRFKERAEKGQLGETEIFKVTPKTLKFLDFSKGLGSAAIEEITL